ncbi:MAG: hypothetical protein VX915_02910 [Pseudomonadota bacterium]|nr:hypothetical protein [Pseudomonadota bacterium]
MTRKEPQFSDDLNTPIAVAESTDLVRSDIGAENARRVTATPPKQSSSNWLLWLFVGVSLCVSFGMAFFGLEEAGRYQAALTQAESQARELEATIDRLNDAQTQGIGELAQSDAQMRKMVQSVEARLKSDVTRDFDALAKQVKSVQQDIETSQVTVAEEFGVVGKQIQSIEQTLGAVELSSRAAQSKFDESVALLSEQINAERTRIDTVAGTRQAVIALSDELRSLQIALSSLDGRLQAANAGQASTDLTVKDIQLALDEINEQLAQLATTNNALIVLDVLSEQVDRLAQQTEQQQQVIDAVDASRKQLTQRIIDLDGRVNLALSPRE